MGGRVLVLFGGRSGEHEISVRSAATVIEALRESSFDVLPVGVAKSGRWWTADTHAELLASGREALTEVPDEGTERCLTAGSSGPRLTSIDGKDPRAFDIVFPVLHGTYGEDGTIQGLLEMYGAAYVGAGVAASALCMDKILTKHVLQDAGIPTGRWVGADASREDPTSFASRIASGVGYPCFVKPANSGSSVGISKVTEPSGLEAAWAEAAQYDDRVIIETAIDGREIECGVIGNERPEVSVMGELIPSRDFYDYVDKYIANDTRLEIPAELSPEVAQRLKTLAANAYRVLGCSGLARVDFFVEHGTNGIYLNEPNTMPGFTRGSMFPKLWEASGVSLTELVTRLIELGLARHERRSSRRLSITTPTADQ